MKIEITEPDDLGVLTKSYELKYLEEELRADSLKHLLDLSITDSEVNDYRLLSLQAAACNEE